MNASMSSAAASSSRCSVRFKDEQHLLRIINKIVSAVGRRVDESHPLCDARLQDGSRVNVAVRPIGVDGPLVSIRKFSKKPLQPQQAGRGRRAAPADGGSAGAAVKARITTIISGGTGSGKTTMLNALSAFISEKERLITIEDAAELQLQQPHVGRMETRPPNIEGKGEIRQRELVKNALRMRPDRIILGECRGEEAFDMLQAMNTGHEGSMATIHANTPRDAISRLEQMIGMAGLPMTVASIRGQIAGAIQLIVQLQRQSDGKRKVTSIAEITGLEGDIIQMQEIFKFVRTGTGADGAVLGPFRRDRHPAALPRRARQSGHQVARHLFRPRAGAYNVRHQLQFRPGLFVLSPGRRLGGDVCRRRLSAAARRSLLPQEHQPPAARRRRQADRESVLVQLRRERGLTSGGEYRLPLINLNQLLLQSGLTLGFTPADHVHRHRHGGDLRRPAGVRPRHSRTRSIGALFSGLLLPLLLLKLLRWRRQKKFSAQFPDAIDIIVRSLRAGHPVPIAITMVAREMPDPAGSEFGIVVDEITYGADLETAMRNLYFRVGTDDLPLFVTAVAIQGSTGGNLGEILENLSGVIRQRFKMRRKIRALAAEGRASALILSSLPICIFAAIQLSTPEFYASVWHESMTKIALGARRLLDGGRQRHHVPHGQFQGLTDADDRLAHERRACATRPICSWRCWCFWPPAPWPSR